VDEKSSEITETRWQKSAEDFNKQGSGRIWVELDSIISPYGAVFILPDKVCGVGRDLIFYISKIAGELFEEKRFYNQFFDIYIGNRGGGIEFRAEYIDFFGNLEGTNNPEAVLLLALDCLISRYKKRKKESRVLRGLKKILLSNELAAFWQERILFDRDRDKTPKIYCGMWADKEM